MFKSLRNEEGSIIVIVTVSLVALMSLSALVIDLGRVYVEKSKLQNALDAAVLAAAQTLPDVGAAIDEANLYFEKNGYDPADLELDFYNTRVDARYTKEIEYTFAKIIGRDTASITANAAGMKDSVGEAFNYALFSGSNDLDLNLNGSFFVIGGGLHSNRRINIYCSSINVDGACEAASLITIQGSSVNVPLRLPNSPPIGMPDFSDVVQDLAIGQGTIYYGDRSFSGPEFSFDKAVFVDGDINFNGSSLNMITDGSVCFYSIGGDININGANIDIGGILYAQTGSVRINCSRINVNGRIIGNALSVNTSSLTINASDDDLDALPQSGGGVMLVK
jgi:hypothetical protein